MAGLTKLNLSQSEVIRRKQACSVLGSRFFNKYSISLAQQAIEEKEQKKLEKQKKKQQKQEEKRALKMKPVDSSDDEYNLEDDIFPDEAEWDHDNYKEKKKIKSSGAAVNQTIVEVKGIEFDWIFNSKHAHALMKVLSETNNINLFKVPVIEDIILFKWSYFRWAIIILLFIPFLLYFGAFLTFATWGIKEDYEYEKKVDGSSKDWETATKWLAISCVVFIVGFVYVELRQLWFHKLNYFVDIWNMMDMISLGLNITTLSLWMWDDNQELLNAFASIACLIMWGKMFYFLRIFFATAHLVRMIIEIIYDMRYFILIFFISVFAFANAFYILGRNMSDNLAGSTFLLGFIYSYRMGLGDWDTGDFDGRDQWLLYTLWFLNSFIILIVLLNLVIAIMGDSFDRIQERSEQSLLQELT